MIIVTGAAGFIGSCVAKVLQQTSQEGLVLVDDFSHQEKEANLNALQGVQRIERDDLEQWLANQNDVSAVIHIGARTDTTEFDKSIFDRLNVAYSKMLWRFCTQHDVPLIYASSAATYGGGEHGYSDNHAVVPSLKPLNPYGDSKNEFDLWVLQQDEAPTHWYGLKFFNVFGPNEYHKGRMASVVFHAFNQISSKNAMRLFRSHNPDFKDGEQLRDFVYVKDVIKVIRFLLDRLPESGLYNLGTGKARTFVDLTKAVFTAMDKEEQISFIVTPLDIRDKYQYFTEADMSKLERAGYNLEFYSLETAVEDYVQNYLVSGRFYDGTL